MQRSLLASLPALLLFSSAAYSQTSTPSKTFFKLQEKAALYRSSYRYSLAVQFDSLSVLEARRTNDNASAQQAVNGWATDYLHSGQVGRAEKILDDNKRLFGGEATRETSRWYEIRGNCRFRQMDFTNALAAYRDGRKIATALGDTVKATYFTMLVGKMHLYQGKTDSLRLVYEAMDYFKANGQFRQASQSASVIAFASYVSFHLAEALDYYQKALAFATQAKDESVVADTRGSLGDVYIAQKKYPEAIEQISSAQRFYQEHKILHGLAVSHIRLGQAYTEGGDFAKATQELNEAEALANELNLVAMKMSVAGARIKLKLKMGDEKGADSIGLKGLSLAKSVDPKLLSLAVRKQREGGLFAEKELQAVEATLNIKTQTKKGRYFGVPDSALPPLVRLNNLTGKDVSQDSTVLAMHSRQLARLETQYRTRILADSLSIQKKDAVLAKQESKNKNLVIYSGSLLLLLASVGGWLQYKNRRRAERDKARIQLLQNEIHHRVKNNLAVINRLVDVAGKDSVNDASLDALKTRIKSIELLHRHLYSEEAATGNIALQPYLNDLCTAIAATFAGTKNIRIHVTADAEVDSAVAEKLGLIVNELVTNSFKYAFAGKEEGSVDVKATQEENALKLVVQDDGIGMPETKAKGSYGMRLIKGLSHELNGSFSFQNHRGTRFQLSLPQAG